MGQYLKEHIRRGIESAGFDLVPLHRDETARIQSLISRYGIASVIDVGANQGQYARRMRTLGYRGQILSFEPGAEAFALLRRNSSSDPSWVIYRTALGRTRGKATLHVSRNSVSSSLLAVAPDHVVAAPESIIDRIEDVEISLLDDVAKNAQAPLWLKIDTQGYELEVLAGGSETIGRTDVLQLELSLRSLYVDQSDYRSLLDFVHVAGFTIVDVIPGFRSASGDLLQCDVLAVRIDDAAES